LDSVVLTDARPSPVAEATSLAVRASPLASASALRTAFLVPPEAPRERVTAGVPALELRARDRVAVAPDPRVREPEVAPELALDEERLRERDGALEERAGCELDSERSPPRAVRAWRRRSASARS
jgi:hypothetical protein